MEADLPALRRALKRKGNKRRAKHEKAYLKSPLEHHGVPVPDIQRLAVSLCREHPELEGRKLLSLVDELWSSPFHEERTLALRLLRLHPELLTKKQMARLERMLGQCHGWAHVDDLAINLVGAVLEQDSSVCDYLDKWSRSSRFWMRRAALISQIHMLREGKGDIRRFLGYAEKMLGDKEFFIRKAIGWALRELSKARPKETYAFLKKHKAHASKLTLREGAKRLSLKERRALGL